MTANDNDDMVIQAPLSVLNGKLGFWSVTSGMVKDGPSFYASEGNVTLSNFHKPVTLKITIQPTAPNYEFLPDARDSLAIGPAAEGPPKGREWNPAFDAPTVSADRKTLTFVDRNNGNGAFEYTLTLLNTATGQREEIDPKITNRGED